MDEESRKDLERAGEVQMRRAGLFWAAFNHSAHAVRRYVVLGVHYRCLLRIEDDHPEPRPRVVAELRRRIDNVHDLRLDEEKNMDLCAETARAAEMMARIFYEDADDREPTLIPNPQRFDVDGR